ncbi:MAG: efflux RND transporter periplasmic adaptor subunit [Gemmatimonadota bacterium]
MKRKVYVGIGVVVLVAVGAALLWPRNSDDAPAGPSVRTGTASVSDIHIVLNETGTVEPVRTVVVKSPISGTVLRLHVEEGDRAREGQVLAVLEPDLPQARAVAELRATHGQAEVALREAERSLRDGRALSEQGLLAGSELARLEAEFRRAQLEVQSGEEQLRALEQAGITPSAPARNVTVTAPAAGVVIGLGAEEGESVFAGTGTLGGGTELVKIADLSRLLIKAEVNEVDIGKVSLEQPVRITVDAYPNAEFEGRVSHVAPAARVLTDTKVRVFDVEVAVASPDPRLRPGMTANLDVEGPRRDSVLTVPIEAVFRKGGGDVVYKIVKGQPVQTAVTLGLVDIARAEIVDGLQAGDSVALEDPEVKKSEAPARS